MAHMNLSVITFPHFPLIGTFFTGALLFSETAYALCKSLMLKIENIQETGAPLRVLIHKYIQINVYLSPWYVARITHNFVSRQSSFLTTITSAQGYSGWYAMSLIMHRSLHGDLLVIYSVITFTGDKWKSSLSLASYLCDSVHAILFMCFATHIFVFMHVF